MKPSPPQKPRLRGVFHLVACLVGAVASAMLVSRAPTWETRVAGAVYGLTMSAMLGMSATYHVPTWSHQARMWLRRLDHASIFLFLGGSYTPFCMLALPREEGTRLMLMAWAGSALGIAVSILWKNKPRAVSPLLYVMLGWMVLPYIPQMISAIGPLRMAGVFAGGLCYTAGAVVYLRRRPDPLPTVFGYHEVFHLLVIGGCSLIFLVVASMIFAA